VLKNDGNGNFSVTSVVKAGYDSYNMTHIDIDGDGDQDAIVVSWHNIMDPKN